MRDGTLIKLRMFKSFNEASRTSCLFTTLLGKSYSRLWLLQPSKEPVGVSLVETAQ